MSNAEPPVPAPETVGEELLRRLRSQRRMMVGLFGLLFATVAYFGWQGDKVHDSLCTIRSDREAQSVIATAEIQRTRNLLDPDKPPAIPPSLDDPETIGLIEAGLTRDKTAAKGNQATVDALGDLNC